VTKVLARRVSLSLALLACAPADAAFLDTGAGARAPGMGNAFAAIADDVYAIHYNPAGLALLTRPELATSYSRLLLGLTDESRMSSSFIGYAHPLREGLGTTAVSWQQFDLNGSLYQDQAFSLSYGNRLLKDLGDGDLYAGTNLKLLRRAFGSSPEAEDAKQGLVSSGRADPVLSGRRSLIAPDLDLGVLYRLHSHYAAALSLFNVNQPDVAFSSSDSDTLPLNVKLGLGYRSILSNVSAQYETVQSPSGTRDMRLTLGAERWFPWLLVGNVGVRGALSVGSREHKQLSMGMTYKNTRYGVDYGFSLPLGGVGTIQGAHRIGFSVRFGGLQEPEESAALILEAMRALKSGQAPPTQAQGRNVAASQARVIEEYLMRAKSFEAEAKYEDALASLGKALALTPEDPALLKNFGRLNLVATTVKSLPDFKTDPVQGAWHQGIQSYLASSDNDAIAKVTYALSLKPDHKELHAFLTQLEMATGLKRQEAPKVSDATLRLDAMVLQAISAIEQGRYDEAIDLSKKVLSEQPGNLSAWENLGISYFAIGDYAKSVEAWEKALSLERNPARRSVLASHLKSVRNVIQRPKAPKMAAPTASPEEILRRYNEGLDYYSSGQLEKAKAAFERVLEWDPQHASAAKALRRVKEELKSR
jgi:tetratricopeptide (TPR) repeat protein